MIAPAVAALAGIVFAIGLVISDMTSPSRVVAFLDIGGSWDPTLGFVMAGAIAVYAPVVRLVRRRPAPTFGAKFHLPTARAIDGWLLVGSAIFGVGWGLSGYCPGPAIVASAAGAVETLVFMATLIGGIALGRLVQRDR